MRLKLRKRQIKRAFHKWRLKWLSRQREVDISDCRNCDKWKTCENGEKGHANGTSSGYSIGECRDYVELKGE